MVIYKISISSAGVGFKDFKTAEGEVTEEGGAIIFKYSLDGDSCVLTVRDGKATQERRGEQFVKIDFEEGVKTKCEIGNGGFCGSYEVYTKSLKFISGKGGYKLSLEYLNGNEKQLIKLTFTAVKKENIYEN